MEKECYVSLWVGNFGSFEDTLAYVEKDYSDEEQEDDELYKSELMKEFGIELSDDYDEDFAECICNGRKTRSLAELIEGCSYCESVTKAFVSAAGGELPDSFDSAILLYDHEYKGGIRRSRRAVFIGSVKISYEY